MSLLSNGILVVRFNNTRQEWADKPDFFKKKKRSREEGAWVLLYRHTVLPYVLLLQQLRLLRQFLQGNRKTEESEVNRTLIGG